MEDFRTSLFSDCSLMKTVTSTKKSWCAALPIRKRKIKSIASSNWIDCRLLLQQIQKAILHMPLTKVQTLINWTSPKSKSYKRSIESRCKKNAGKSSWMERTNRTTALNQLNHWIHLTKVRSRNENFVREEGCPHELSCGYSRTCAIFFAPRPRAFTKIAIFVLQNVPNVQWNNETSGENNLAWYRWEASPKKIDSIESISLQTCVEKWSPLTAIGKRAQTQSFSCEWLKNWRL